MKRIISLFLLAISFLFTYGCSQNESVDYSSVGSIVNHSEYGDSDNNGNFEAARTNAEEAFELITSMSVGANIEYELITDEESNVIAISLEYDDLTMDSYMNLDNAGHQSLEESFQTTSSIWYQGLTNSYDIQEDRYKACAIKDKNGEIITVLVNEDGIYDAWQEETDNNTMEENRADITNSTGSMSLSRENDTSTANNSAEQNNGVSASSSPDSNLLTSDENMDLSFVSADTTNGIIFEVNNKTDKNLNWQYDSIALNKRSINSQDFYVSSGDIAPNSIGEFVLSLNYGADASKYNWSEGVSVVSGQLRYYIGEGYNDMVSVSFSDVAV